MAAPDEKSFVTLGQLCNILGNEIIVSDSSYDPNGILPGTWGHYEGTTWYDTAEVLTVLINGIKSDGKLMLSHVDDTNFRIRLGYENTGTTPIWANLQAADDEGSTHTSAIDEVISYYSGLTTDTKLLYRWYRK